jgi:large subunit ribosomal protein L21
MYAVIKTGGKQYRVAANDTITIEKLIGEAGEHVHFTDVLMVADGEKIEVGAPLVTGATVVGEIAGQIKSPTVYIFKKRRRKHHRRRNGHRQLLTSVRITDILIGGAKPAQKAAAPKKVEAPKVEAAKPAPKAEAPKPAPKAEPVKAAAPPPPPPPAPVAKAEPVKAAPVAAAPAPRAEAPKAMETVKATPAAPRDTSHLVETVKGTTKQDTGEHRVAKAVEGGHRVEAVHTPDRDNSHIVGTVKGETVQSTTASRVATPIAGGHRTVEIEGDPNEGKDHILSTVRGEVRLAPGVKLDDISLIGGIGPKIEEALHARGFKTWAQIANLTAAQIETLNTELKLMGRIGREEWIEQAKELMAGKPPRAKTDKARKDQE